MSEAREDSVTESEEKSIDWNRIKFEDFAFGNKIGSGKYGNVARVKHKQTGQIYACKIIKIKTKSGCYDYCYKTEIAIHERMNHPNIVKLHGHIVTDERVYLIVDLSPHGDIFNKVNDGIDEELVKIYMRQIVDAVKYIHDKGYIHRDIKPENILLFPEDVVKICDFGWSGRKDNTRGACGTGQYISPEMLRGKKYNQEVDIWALGVLLYEMIYEVPPFDSETNDEDEIFRKIKYSEPKYHENYCSKECVDLIIKLLKKDRTKRIKMDQILKHPWFS